MELSLGPLHTFGHAAMTEEERAFLAAFAEVHQVSTEELRATTLRNPAGEAHTVVAVVPIGIMRKIAASTGKHAGTDPAVFERDASGFPAAATVRVRRTDLPRGRTRTAFWHERVPAAGHEAARERWRTAPDTMLAEVAEALALRGAYPQVLEGVYTEGDLADAVRDQELVRVQASSDLRRQLDALR